MTSCEMHQCLSKLSIGIFHMTTFVIILELKNYWEMVEYFIYLLLVLIMMSFILKVHPTFFQTWTFIHLLYLVTTLFICLQICPPIHSSILVTHSFSHLSPKTNAHLPSHFFPKLATHSFSHILPNVNTHLFFLLLLKSATHPPWRGGSEDQMIVIYLLFIIV